MYVHESLLSSSASERPPSRLYRFCTNVEQFPTVSSHPGCFFGCNPQRGSRHLRFALDTCFEYGIEREKGLFQSVIREVAFHGRRFLKDARDFCQGLVDAFLGGPGQLHASLKSEPGA